MKNIKFIFILLSVLILGACAKETVNNPLTKTKTEENVATETTIEEVVVKTVVEPSEEQIKEFEENNWDIVEFDFDNKTVEEAFILKNVGRVSNSVVEVKEAEEFIQKWIEADYIYSYENPTARRENITALSDEAYYSNENFYEDNIINNQMISGNVVLDDFTLCFNDPLDIAVATYKVSFEESSTISEGKKEMFESSSTIILIRRDNEWVLWNRYGR
ncbi:MAG: hypothetical protein K0R15_2091 [Clostridiales bacterium]|jgi:hypothetical protein|nr:hypothetical protein [Clostridiales bacterium]